MVPSTGPCEAGRARRREQGRGIIDGVHDAELVARVLAGERAAFEPLARRHFQAAYAIALAHMRDADDAEDVCQEALLRAYDRLAQCREPERFGAWLLRIVRNQAIKRRAYFAVRRAVQLDAATNASVRGTPDDVLRRAELRRTLTRALHALRPAQREVVMLHDYQGFAHREIAERMGISEVMSRRHLSDARALLRRRLQVESEEPIV